MIYTNIAHNSVGHEENKVANALRVVVQKNNYGSFNLVYWTIYADNHPQAGQLSGRQVFSKSYTSRKLAEKARAFYFAPFPNLPLDITLKV